MNHVLLQSEIEALIPHRDHALFLVQADIMDDYTGTAKVQWEATHPVLVGHFPDFVIVPGMFLLEAAAQLGGLIIAHKEDVDLSRELGVLTAVKKLIIYAPVRPGQLTEYRVRVQPQGQGYYEVTGTAQVGLVKVVSFSLLLVRVSRSVLARVDEQIFYGYSSPPLSHETK